MYELLEDELKNIKSGRASSNIFDAVESTPMERSIVCRSLLDCCQGANILLVKVFDETIKEDVIKHCRGRSSRLIAPWRQGYQG